MTLAQASDLLRKRELSAKELVSCYVERMAHARHLNAYITETIDIALQQAAASDARLRSGVSKPLDGIPLAIKDNFCTTNVKTTAGSKILSNFISPYESTVTAKLRDAGCALLGKLNMDEFAMGSSNITSYFGPVISPWKSTKFPDKNFVPGGSSGGPAAAVAAGLALATLGTDTGGSIRQPAAFCGLVGVKPTYGAVSRFGIIALASSLDQAGSLTRTVRDAALICQEIFGYDAKDATSAPVTHNNFSDNIGQSLKGLRIGIPKEYSGDGIDPQISKSWEDAIAHLTAAGCEIIAVSLPHTKYALPCYCVILPAEASSNLARYDGMRYGLRCQADTVDEMYELTRGAGFGDEVKRRILMGTYLLSHGYFDAYYTQAQKVRALIKRDFDLVLSEVDALLAPTTPSAAFAIGEEPKDPVTMYMNDVLTVPANLAGNPSISVPAGLTTDGLPIGLQLIGRAFDESTLFKIAHVVEQMHSPKLPFS